MVFKQIATTTRTANGNRSVNQIELYKNKRHQIYSVKCTGKMRWNNKIETDIKNWMQHFSSAMISIRSFYLRHYVAVACLFFTIHSKINSKLESEHELENSTVFLVVWEILHRCRCTRSAFETMHMTTSAELNFIVARHAMRQKYWNF